MSPHWSEFLGFFSDLHLNCIFDGLYDVINVSGSQVIAENEKREDGEQKKLPKPPCPWLSAIMKGIEAINLAREQTPLEQWPEPHLIILKDSLRPFVELHHKLEELFAD